MSAHHHLRGTRQATYTCVPLSPSSIIWYQASGWSLWLGRYHGSGWK